MNKILQGFLNSNIKIKSQEKLEEYIDYCILNNQKKRIKSKTSYHHILPNKLFPEYSKLKENKWNGTYLLHSDHYYAHWLLTEAIDNYSMLSAFCAMHNKDKKLEKINEEDLISKDEFQKKMEEKNKRHSLLLKKGDYSLSHKSRIETLKKQKFNIDGIEMNGLEYSSYKAKQTNIENKSSLIANINEAAKRKKDGTYKKIGMSVSKYLNTKIKVDGKETTNAREIGKKISKTLNEIIIVDGHETSLAKKRGEKIKEVFKLNPDIIKKRVETLKSNAKVYIIKNKNNSDTSRPMRMNEIRKISQVLPSSSADKYLGRTNRSKEQLIKNNKKHLIGSYIEEFYA